MSSKQPANFDDLSGRLFGRLTVIKRGPTKITPGGQRKTNWWCRCACGNPGLILVAATALKSGHTQSCGCLQRERTSEARKRTNQYEFHEDCVVGYLANGESFILDKEDYEKVKPYSWYKTSNGYIATRDRKADGALKTMHRLITEAIGSDMVDHINHDKRDNRRCNLRIVSRSENQQNRKAPVNCPSRVRGVSRDKRNGKWISKIWVNKQYKYLGAYQNFDDAVAARKAAEERYFGEYSYDNSIAAVPRIAV